MVLENDIIGQQTDFTFTITLQHPLESTYEIIFEFDAELGINIPDTVISCIGDSGFTDSAIPCIKQSET